MCCSIYCCPLCQSLLHSEEKQWRCEQGHCFDVARQGYVNLLPVQHKKSKEPGDSKEMVEARYQFLSTGVYTPIAQALWRALESWLPEGNVRILDAGCGEGYYLDALSKQLDRKQSDLIGLDIAKPAIHKAAVQYKQAQWIVGTNRHLPLVDACLDAVVCMFGFASFDVFARVLKPGGVVIMVDPAEQHLIELRHLIYPEIKEKAAPDSAAWETAGLVLASENTLSYEHLALSKEQLQNLILMTPHFFRAPQGAREKVAQLGSLDVTVSASIRVLQKV